MASILIRNLDHQFVKRLKDNAKRHGRSLQAEAKSILMSGVKLSAAETLLMLREWKKRFKGRKFSDSTQMVREMRDAAR